MNTKIALLAIVLMLGACGTHIYHQEAAQRLAMPSFMLRHEIAAGPFILTSYEREREGSPIAQVYIEGGEAKAWSGGVWESGTPASHDSTPGNPVALHLAAKAPLDRSVIWLARPCQYTAKADGQACDRAYWLDKRFAPEVLAAYGTALDDLTKRYGFTGYEVIGYGSGAVIAAHLAAKRPDIVSLRTVAGELNALPALAAAPDLTNMPQRHFIGGQDSAQPSAALHTFLGAIGQSPCVAYRLVPEATHEAGWVERWSALLEEPVTCIPGV